MENQVVSPALEMHVIMDLEGTTKKIPPMQTPRARLLHSCGESILAMARGAYQRVEAMRCPVGCVARGFSRAAAPVLSPLRLRCLSALAFVDRQLLVVQDVAAVLFPATERVLGKADDLVLLVESLPARLDGAIDGLEALVAGVVTAGLFVLPKRRRRYRADEEDDGAVFRDIWRRCTEQWRKKCGGLPTTWLGRKSRAWRSSRRTTPAAVATPCTATRLLSKAKGSRLRWNATTHQPEKNAPWRRQLQRSRMPCRAAARRSWMRPRRREEAARRKKRRPLPWPARRAGRKHCWVSSIQHGSRS